MKRLFAAAALAAVAVLPASQAGAVPPSNSGGPAGSGACVVVGNPAIPATCRFTAASGSVGYAGFAGPGGTVTLTHKEKVATCNAQRVYAITVNTVTDDSAGAAPDYLGSQGGLVTGTVYTLTVTGPGGFAMGGGSGGPATDEPADTPVDKTNGHAAGAAC
jgi:hypothetical protein